MNFDDLEHLRQPPQSIEAEQHVLGAVMAYPKSLWPVMDILDPNDFYRHDHGEIWKAIIELSERKQPYDCTVVAEWFVARGRAEEVADGAYLIELQMGAFTAANVTAYARIVADKALLRRVIDVGTGLQNAGFNPDGRDTDDIVADATQAMQGLQPKAKGGLLPIKDAAGDWYTDLQKRYEKGDGLTGMPTPWAEFNRRTHGLQKGELVLLAGRPSMGKSIAGLNLALFAAMRGHNTAFFSLEMSRRQVMRRNIASLGDVPHDWLLAPAKGEDDYWSQVAATLARIKAAPLYVDDTADLTISQVMARARMLHAQQPLDLVVADHIHDFKINAREARFEYGKVAQGLKTLAKEFDCPVVGLAQLNRSVTNRAEKMPTLADLRESGELEQKGDLIVFIHRDDYYDKNDRPGLVTLKVAKGRDIEAGVEVSLRNDYRCMALRDLPEGFEPPKATVKLRTGWGE